MNNFGRNALCSLIASMLIILLATAAASAERIKGKIYYTRINIWFESPKKIPSTNYHKGTLLPVGTKVKMISMGNRKIIFRPKGSDSEFVIVHQRKHTRIKFKELFNRYFTKNDPMAPGGKFNTFSPLERKNIRNGNVVHGMGRAAVLMAYGYPPSHRTPSLDSNTWHYWHARIHQITIHFNNNKVSKIETVVVLPGKRKRAVPSTDAALEKPKKRRYKETGEARPRKRYNKVDEDW
jgi:hypothetical protein